ncbi:MAG: flagellar protein FlgN [Syntrophales bacterium]|nr:flagellar protein FlgN [Syntrophales bacterium]
MYQFEPTLHLGVFPDVCPLYDSLIVTLKQEIEIYRDLHTAYISEKEILSGSSLDELYENNSKKETYILKARILGEVRTKTVKKIAGFLDLGEDPDLSMLISCSDDGQRGPLMKCQSELRALLVDISDLNKQNRALLDSSLFYVQSAIDFIGHIVSPGSGYARTGRLAARNIQGRVVHREG